MCTVAFSTKDNFDNGRNKYTINYAVSRYSFCPQLQDRVPQSSPKTQSAYWHAGHAINLPGNSLGFIVLL